MRRLLIFYSLLAAGLRAEEPPPAELTRLFKDEVHIEETVRGDSFVLANDVLLTGTFEQDLWAAGRNIRFRGTALDDVRLFSLEILTIDGPVAGNLLATTQLGNLSVGGDTEIGGHARLHSNQRVSMNGTVKGDLTISAPRAVIDARVEGDLILWVKDVQLLPGTRVAGNIIHEPGTPLPVPDGVEVAGERIEQPRGDTDSLLPLSHFRIWLRVAQLISSFLLGLLLLRALPRFTGTGVDAVLHHRSPCLTIGLLSLLLFGLSGYFLLPTLLGTGLGLVLLTVTALLFYTGKILVAYAIGIRLLRANDTLSFGKLSLALIIGLLVLYTAYGLPYIGNALYILTSCWGMGAMLLVIRQSQQPLKLVLPPNPKTEE